MTSFYDQLVQSDTGAAPAALASTPVTAAPAPAAPAGFYDQLVQREQEEGRLRVSVQQASQVTPEKAAQRQYLSKVTGLAPGLIESNEGEATAAAKFQEILEQSRTSPVLRAKLQDPTFTALAQDDVSPLSQIEKGIRELMRPNDPNFKRGATATGKFLVEGGKQLLMGGTAGLGAAIADTAGMVLDQLGQVRLGGMESFGNAAATYRQRAEAARESMKFFSDKTEGNLEAGFMSGMQSSGQNLAMLPAAAEVAVMKGAHFAGQALATIFGVTTGAAAYTQAREKGLDPGGALTYAVPHGVFEYAFESIPASRLLADIVKHSNIGTMVARQIIPEMLGEQATTVMQDLNEWVRLNPQKTLKEFIAERPDAAVQTAVATLVGIGVQSGTVRAIQSSIGNVAEQEARAHDAEQYAGRMQQLLQIAAGSKLRERDPAGFAAFAQEAATEAGFDGKAHIDGSILAEALQQAGITPEAFAQMSPQAGAELATAAQSGGTVGIPIGDLVGTLAQTGLEQTLLPHLRMTEEALSQEEAKLVTQQAQQMLHQESARLMAQVQDSQAAQASSEVVKNQLADQLATANRFTADVNQAYAALAASFYTATAARYGITAEEMYARYPLRIQATTGADLAFGQGRTVQVDGVRYPDTDSTGKPLHTTFQGQMNFWRTFKNSQAVNEAGQPLVLYHGTAGDFNAFDRGEAGKTTGAANAGQGFFLSDRPGIAGTYAKMAGPEGANVMPVYANLQNPLRATAPSMIEADKLVLNLPAEYDGAIIDVGDGPAKQTVYLVRNATQIKSAIGNNGQFDAGDPNVLSQSVSTRVPWAKPRGKNPAVIENPLTERLQVGLEAFKDVPDALDNAMALITTYPNWNPSVRLRTTEQKVEHFVQEVMDNLLWLHDLVPAEIRERSKKWYDGANVLANVFAQRYGITVSQASAVLAVNSPQTEWFTNVSRAERIFDIWFNQQEFRWSPEMEETGQRVLSKYTDELADLRGKTLGELAGDSTMQAMWLRVFDESHNDRAHRIVTPEGALGDWVYNKDGETKTKTAWASFAHIAKSIEIINDGGLANVSLRLGQEHKVRSFYNNIFAPMDPVGDVTIDTHAVAAGLLRPLAGSNIEVEHNLGGGVSNALKGLSGTYGIYAEAYRRAAAARGVLPREMQSITWEAVRGLYTDTFKSSAAAEQIEEAWQLYRKNKLTEDQVRAKIIELSGGVNEPNWWQSDRQPPTQTWDSSYGGQLSEFRVPAGDAAPAAGRDPAGSGAGSRAGSADAGQTSRDPGDLARVSRYQEALLAGRQLEDLNAEEQAQYEVLAQSAVTQDVLPTEFDDDVTTLPIPATFGGLPTAGMLYHGGNLDEATDKQSATVGGKPVVSYTRSPMEALEYAGHAHGDVFARAADGANIYQGGDAALDAAVVANNLDALASAGYDGVDLRALTGGGYNEVMLWGAAAQPTTRAAAGQREDGYGLTGTFDASLDQGTGTRGTFSPATLTTTLLEKADLSTFLHETGHFFLEVMADMASQQDAPADLATDMQTILEWFGVRDLATWRGMTLSEQRANHEKFAESFEQYLFEGKAPSRELQGLFGRFRAWLTNVYRSLQQFMASYNTQLSDEVRGVFDRLLATQDQIDEAIATRGFTPLFESIADSGMDMAAWEKYQATNREAVEDAMARLQARSLRDLRWTINARSRELTKISKDVAEKRKVVEAEVRAEVQAEPVFAVQRWLKTGVMADGTETNGAKLSTAALKEMYGDGPASPWRYLATNMVTNELGLHPDVVAEMFGFSSGDEMVRKIVAAFPEASEIQGRTDQRMLERYGDLTSPDGQRRAADEAVHNEARARAIATELAALQAGTTMMVDTGRKNKDGKPIKTNGMLAAAKQFASQLVSNRKVKDLKPAQHLAAETRAAKRAQEASKKGDTQLAMTSKRDQLLNFYAAKETAAALDEIEKGVKYLRKVSSSETLDAGYAEQIDTLLERFNLKNTTAKARDRSATLLEWVEAQRDMGIEPNVPPELLDEARRKPYQEMTVDEFRGLLDTVKQIEHLGRLKHKLLTAKDAREYAEVVARIVKGIIDNAGDRQANTRTPNTVLGEKLVKLQGFAAKHIKAATWARIMDGGKDGGMVWEYIIRAANAAGDKEIGMRETATRELATLVAPILATGKMGGKGIFIPLVRESLNREARLAIALNTGNASNMQRLMGGENWTQAQVDAVLSTVTADEWRFVQKVWDYFESFRPEIAAKEKRVNGVEPKWLEALGTVRQSADGKTVTLRGGYYPVKYDPRASSRAEEHADAEGARQQLKGAYTSATTRRSFTKDRAEEVHGRPLLRSLDGIYQGVNEVIHDLSWHEFLIDANRLVKNDSIAGAMRQKYGPDAHQQFKTWLQDVAAGEQSAANEGFAAWIRQGVSISGLGFNVMSAAIQPLGITQSIERIGAKWVGRGIQQFASRPIETTDMVHGKSEFMRTRALTRLRELAEVKANIKGRSRAREAVDTGAYFLMLRAQQLVDIPTWVGAYEKAIVDAGNNEERAVALADQAVIDSQGSGALKDLSAIERGNQAWKLFTVFYSFFNTALNAGVRATMTEDSKAKLASKYLMLYVMPVVLGALLKDALTAGDSGDWDDPKKIAKKLAREQLSYLFGLMVGVREFAGAAQVALGVNEFNNDYSGPAGVRPIGDLVKLAKQANQGEADNGLRKAVINTAGEALRLPAAQINRTITGAQALHEGKTHNPLALVTGYQEPHH